MLDFSEYQNELLKRNLTEFVGGTLTTMMDEVMHTRHGVQLIFRYAEKDENAPINIQNMTITKLALDNILELTLQLERRVLICAAFWSEKARASWEHLKDRLDIENTTKLLQLPAVAFIETVVKDYRDVIRLVEQSANTILAVPSEANSLAYDIKGEKTLIRNSVEDILKHMLSLRQWLNLYEAYAEKLRREAT